MKREWVKTILTAVMLCVSFYGTCKEPAFDYDKETFENIMLEAKKTIKRLFHFKVDIQ